MKRICLIVLVVAAVLSCATTNLPTDNIDELLGEWVNPLFNPKGGANLIYRGKVIWRADGIHEIYPSSVADTSPLFQQEWTLVRKWQTKDGAIFFEITKNLDGANDRAKSYKSPDGPEIEAKALIRLSADGSTYEQIANLTRLRGDEATFPTPEEINIMHDYYLIYYRE